MNIRKTLRSILGVILCLCMISGTVTAADKETGIPQEREYLKSIGMPEKMADKFSDEHIHKLYMEFYGNNVEACDSSEKYISFDKSGRMVSTYAQIPSSTMLLSIVHFKEWSGTSVSNVTVSIMYEWLKAPSIKRNDAITVNWDPDVFTYSWFVGASMIQDAYGDDETQIDFYSNPDITNQGGLGFWVSLKPPDPKYVYPYGEFSIGLLPKRVGSLTLSAGILSAINLNYAHHYSPVGSVSIGYNGFGVSIDTSGWVDFASNSTTFFSGSRN